MISLRRVNGIEQNGSDNPKNYIAGSNEKQQRRVFVLAGGLLDHLTAYG